MLLTVFIIMVVIALAAITARLAESRERNFWVYFVFCTLFPIASVIAIPYLLLRRRSADVASG